MMPHASLYMPVNPACNTVNQMTEVGQTGYAHVRASAMQQDLLKPTWGVQQNCK